jgi:motility quorum-sensing regulator/GCU-specific mRNA interferase toxin
MWEQPQPTLAANNQVGYYASLEKRSPHCQLSVVKTLIQQGKVRSTFSALAGGAALGFDFDGIVAVVLALTPKDFYKSMTTHADHKVWQDVYRPTTKAGEVYLKLTVIDDVLIVSFKEL